MDELKSLMENDKYFMEYVLGENQKLFAMIECNIFRPLSSFKRGQLNLVETGEIKNQKQVFMDFDPAWPYLAGIYNIFYAFI